LNNNLYLHSAGIETLPSLNLYLYYRLKCLHLSGNHITRIEGLEYLTGLRSLFLQSNKINRIENIEMLIELRTLDLSNNHIKKIENVKSLVQLNILNLELNLMSVLDEEQGLELSCLTALTQLNLSRNNLELDNPVSFFTTYTPNIKCLYMQGNQAMRGVANLRHSLLEGLPNLTFLDSRHVSRQTNTAPPLSPARAVAITERRALALARIARERNGLEDPVDITDAELEIYAGRVRREFGENTTNDEASSQPSMEETPSGSLSLDEME
jgi:Leucine-rich repeat (LRR) protein